MGASAMSDFRPGDDVVLNSGGPTMTVSAVEGGKVICIRVGDEKSMQEPFEPTTLILEEEVISPAKEDD
jgi:uncharacterized protein YodC (DUF2158 family)